MSLVARLLEESGIPTVILGSAIDIVEHVGVPRFLFTDFPLGNPCGVPWNREMQHDILLRALAVFESAKHPRTTVQVPHVWGSHDWRTRYMEVRDEDREWLLKKGEENRRERAEKPGTQNG